MDCLLVWGMSQYHQFMLHDNKYNFLVDACNVDLEQSLFVVLGDGDEDKINTTPFPSHELLQNSFVNQVFLKWGFAIPSIFKVHPDLGTRVMLFTKKTPTQKKWKHFTIDPGQLVNTAMEQFEHVHVAKVVVAKYTHCYSSCWGWDKESTQTDPYLCVFGNFHRCKNCIGASKSSKLVWAGLTQKHF